MMTHRTSKQLKASARQTLLGHYSLPITGLLLLFLITTILESLINRAIPFSAGGFLIGYFSLLIVSLFTSLLDAGYSYLMLNMARQKEYRLADLFFAFKNMPDHAILISVRLFLLTLACLIPTLIGLILVTLFPGASLFFVLYIILMLVSLILAARVAISYSQIYYIYLDDPYLSPKEVMLKSKLLMEGNYGRYLYLLFSFTGVMLLGILSFTIGFIWLTPYMSMTQAEFYRDLIGETQN